MSAFTPKYKFRDGFRVTAVDAQTVGEVCENLSNTVGLTSKTLLDASRAESAPLHNCFEWRDNVAAEKYREVQAQYIIRSVVVISEDKPEVRAFSSVVVQEKKEFKHIDTIVRNEDLKYQLLKSAKKELYAFQVKYNALKGYAELSDVFTSINNLKEKEKQDGTI